MQYKKFPISTAKFLQEGTEVLLGSQYYPHCHSYNLLSGKTYKVLLPHGITNMQVFIITSIIFVAVLTVLNYKVIK